MRWSETMKEQEWIRFVPVAEEELHDDGAV